MRIYIGIVLLILSCTSCTTHNVHKSSAMRTIQGYTYDRLSGEKLKGTTIYNLTQGDATATDSIGRFKLTANIGDSIRFLYIGMRDSVLVLSKNTPTYLEVGLDTAYMPLIGPEVIRLKHISQTDYRPYQFDNGDDYVRCDRYRIVDNTGKIGYANQQGYVIIEPKYDCALPFDSEKAKVADTGILKEVEDSRGEYHYWESDDWYYIDLWGNRLSE